MKGAVELAAALTQNTALSALDIAWNGFSVEGTAKRATTRHAALTPAFAVARGAQAASIWA